MTPRASAQILPLDGSAEHLLGLLEVGSERRAEGTLRGTDLEDPKDVEEDARPLARRRIAVFPLRGLDGTLGPSPSPGSAPFSSGSPAAAVSRSGWEPGGRTELTAGPPSLALSLQSFGTSCSLFTLVIHRMRC